MNCKCDKLKRIKQDDYACTDCDEIWVYNKSLSKKCINPWRKLHSLIKLDLEDSVCEQ